MGKAIAQPITDAAFGGLRRKKPRLHPPYNRLQPTNVEKLNKNAPLLPGPQRAFRSDVLVYEFDELTSFCTGMDDIFFLILCR